MLQIHRLKKPCVFGGHTEGKDIVQIPLSTLLVPGTGWPGRLGTSIPGECQTSTGQDFD